MTEPTTLASRRNFLSLASAAAAGVGLAMAAPGAAAALTTPRRRVVVLGGGMGGLSAAFELVERGFHVTVVEPKALGGKARSIPVAGTGSGGRRDLPGEHGFRFFPGFYQNIPDTMRRIPVAGNSGGVLDHLVGADQELLTLPGGGQLWLVPSANSAGLMEGMRTLLTTMTIGTGVPANEIEYFVRKMGVFLTSSDARRFGEWEYLPWTTFTNSDHFSPMYRTVFGTGLTKDLVAAKGTAASTRTVGLMGEAFVYSLLGQQNPLIRAQSGYGAADRLLDLPTNEAWIDPWVAHLKALGVTFVNHRRATTLKMRNGRIESVVLEKTDHNGDRVAGAPTTTLGADWFVCAMPVEQMVKLLNPALLAVDPTLGRLHRLHTDWMNGIQFFLNRRPGLAVNGHVAFLDSPWALTSIDQGLFWRKDIAKSYGDGRVKDIYSVDISDFFTPGIVYGKAAADCTPQQIAHEVWAQMKRAFNVDATVLSDDMLVRWFLDPAIHYPNGYGRRAANREPLLINTPGSYDNRPTATTKVPNLFLASDYVRSNVDLATMEGANEAGRAAANGILRWSGSSRPPAVIKKLWAPEELAATKVLDEQLYRAGQPNLLDVVPAGLPL